MFGSTSVGTGGAVGGGGDLEAAAHPTAVAPPEQEPDRVGEERPGQGEEEEREQWRPGVGGHGRRHDDHRDGRHRRPDLLEEGDDEEKGRAVALEEVEDLRHGESLEGIAELWQGGERRPRNSGL